MLDGRTFASSLLSPLSFDHPRYTAGTCPSKKRTTMSKCHNKEHPKHLNNTAQGQLTRRGAVRSSHGDVQPRQPQTYCCGWSQLLKMLQPSRLPSISTVSTSLQRANPFPFNHKLKTSFVFITSVYPHSSNVSYCSRASSSTTITPKSAPKLSTPPRLDPIRLDSTHRRLVLGLVLS